MFDLEKIHPDIFVFKNVIKNSEEIISYYEKKEGWVDWYTFGKMLQVYSRPTMFDNFPSKEEWNSKISTKGQQINNKYLKLITTIFYETTEIYFKEKNIKKNNLRFDGFNIAKYFSGAGVDEKMAMMYHTDTQQERKNIPEYKFDTTCLFYLNDNYMGGEISFKVLNKEQSKIEHSLDYKPSAGDVVIFPSKEPFYHGVKKSYGGEKYIMRTYWKTLHQKNNFWKNGVDKYGEDNWISIQEEKSYKMRNQYFSIENNKEKIFFQGIREE